jgi:hypothetical protein
MNCKELNKSLIGFMEGEFAPGKQNEFIEHIKACNNCSDLYSSVKDNYNALNVKREIEPKAFFTESVMNKIDNEKVKENIFDVTLDIAISKFFKEFAYTGVAFIIALFIILYSSGNLSLFSNSTEDDDFSTNKVSTVFFENL